MILYKTIEKDGQAEQTIEKSKFIAYARYVSSKEDADAFIFDIKKMNKTATHNVPVIVVGDKFQIQWASDDGEPQGTSGAPILQMLVKEEITNVAVVVTRYFGGIKLGTGGLIRAYTSSAKLAINAAGVCEVLEKVMLEYRLDYTFLGRIQSAAGDGMFAVSDIEYEDKIKIKIVCDPENQKAVALLISNLTSGTGMLKNQQKQLVKIKI